jgi:hypothetical protein
MAAGQCKTWRILVAGDGQARASALLSSLLRFPRIEAGVSIFRVSACSGSRAERSKEGGCVECRLDSPLGSEAETIQIVEEKTIIHSQDSELAEEVAALIIAVDGSAMNGLADSVLTRLAALLRRLAEARQHAMEPAGFPFFVVLTEKTPGTVDHAVAGTLPLPPGEGRGEGELTTTWVRDRLLEESGLANDPSTRAINVQIEDLAGPDSGKEIGDLFSRCLSAALNYGRSITRAHRRLAWTSGGATAALVMMLLLAVGLNFRSQPSAISLEVNALRALVSNRSGWLHEPYDPKFARLVNVENDPDFSTLSTLDQAFIRQTGQELRDYQEYRAKLRDVDLNRPRSRLELVALQAELMSGRLAVPEQYRELWQRTNAWNYHDVLLEDLRALQIAIDRTVAWYADWTTKLDRLYAFGGGRPKSQGDWAAWHTESADALSAGWPHSAGDPIPDAVMLTYVSVIQSPEVVQGRRQWALERDRLEQLWAFVMVLGLGGPLPGGQQPPLEIGPGFRAEESASRLKILQLFAPDLERGLLPTIPEAIAGDIRRVLAEDYRNLIEAGRSVVREHYEKLNDGENNWQAWQKLLPYLSRPDDLLAWRTLTAIIQQLRREPPADPISALATFLKRDHFDLDPLEAELRVPHAVMPSGSLVIDLDGPNSQWIFDVSGEPARDNAAGVLRYRFKRVQGNSARFVPGDRIRGSLGVRRSDRPGTWSLVWDRPINNIWAFDALVRLPRWVESNASAGANDPAPSARLTLLPAASWPSVPDLLPATTADARQPVGHLP